VLAHRPHQQFRIDAVKEGLDIKIKNPITTPASLPRHADCIERRFAGPVSIGIPVELWLHQRFQMPFDHHLGDAISDRGDVAGIVHLMQFAFGMTGEDVPNWQSIPGVIPIRAEADSPGGFPPTDGSGSIS
jgi:hypothetical protein